MAELESKSKVDVETTENLRKIIAERINKLTVEQLYKLIDDINSLCVQAKP